MTSIRRKRDVLRSALAAKRVSGVGQITGQRLSQAHDMARRGAGRWELMQTFNIPREQADAIIRLCDSVKSTSVSGERT